VDLQVGTNILVEHYHLHEISGCHCGEYEDYSLLGYNGV
jgi:hypothetical protein